MENEVIEMVDIVDEHDVVIFTVSRHEMRQNRLRHRAVFIAVMDGAGRLLVHRRSPHKDVWPGWCDIAVGGVVSAGESYVAAAIRELNEEVGIQDVSVEPLDGGICQTYEDDQVSLMGRCFIVQAQSPLTFNDGEVAEAWWVHRDGLDELIRREKVLPDSLALLLPLLDF